jgi:uncharacterized protein (DUF2062 family)
VPPKAIPEAEPTPRTSLLKRFLRFMPRRANLHRYPVIGRFAPQLRTRSYLWSFRRQDVRTAYYAGSVLAFLPLLGIQLPLSLLAALLLRSNFMVLGGIQFLTNPVTAAPLYYTTYRLGSAMLESIHVRLPAPAIQSEQEAAELGGYVAESLMEPLVPERERPPGSRSRFRSGVGAMMIGGALLGLIFGALCDLADRLLRHRLRRAIPRPAAAAARPPPGRAPP